MLSGAEAANGLSTSILLPHLEVQTGFFELDAADTSILIVNPGLSTASVSAEFVDLSGKSRMTTSLQIPAGDSVDFRASDHLSKVLPSNGVGGIRFEGYLRLTSNLPIAAWQQVETPLSRSALRGSTPAELKAASVAVMPHFVFGGNYGTFINLINPDTRALSLELSAHDNRGNTIGETIRIVLQPGEARRSSVGEFFRVVVPAIFPAPIVEGYVRIRGQDDGDFVIAGNVEIFGNLQGGRSSTMLSPVSTATGLQWYLPFSTSNGEYFSGYAVVARNSILAVQTDVIVEVLGPDGTVVSTTSASLSPGSRIATMIPDNLSTGYLRVRSNLPVFVLGSIGTRDAYSLEYVPPVR